MVIKLRSLLAGLRSYSPFFKYRKVTTGGTDSARYCYSVWLRHLCLLHEAGFNIENASVAELGPGDSIGTGLAALLSGAAEYKAFDVVRYSNTERSLAIFDELVELFKAQTPIPGEDEFPNVHPQISSYDFPQHILTKSVMQRNLSPDRLTHLRADIAHNHNSVSYEAPWNSEAVLRPNAIDLIYSQAVLEHVEDTPKAYEMMQSWLKPGGMMSHRIDYKCHDISHHWNGHWSCGPLLWKIVRGNRNFFLNRHPHSHHRQQLIKSGFSIIAETRTPGVNGIPRSKLAKQYRTMSEEDFCTSGGHFLVTNE